MNNTNTIACSSLCFKRGGREVLRGVSFTLPEGQLLGLLGHNGAGKSTLIKLILGLLRPASGTLTVLGGAPGEKPLEVGYLPENVSFYDAMTVQEHLDFFAGLKGVCGVNDMREVVEKAAAGGVKGVWNFAPADLRSSENIKVQNVHLTDSLMTLSFRINETERIAEDE